MSQTSSDGTSITTNESPAKKKSEIVLYTILFFVFGICHSLTTKFAMESEGHGSAKYGWHQFRKPWWMTTMDLVGMALAAPLYFIMSKCGRYPKISETVHGFKEFAEFLIPSLADIFQGVVSAITVAFVGVSFDVMMKAGTLVGVSFVTRFIFKKHLLLHKWIATLFVIIALVIIGIAGIISSGNAQQIHISKGTAAIIIVLKLVSQITYAAKVCYEQVFTQRRHHHPLLVVGLEGIWSALIMICICLPVVNFLPGQEGNGIHEDFLDTMHQLGNNYVALFCTFFMAFIGLTYNIGSISLTERTSALHRTLIESFRTFVLWCIQIVIYYWFSNSDKLFKYREVGEEWQNGSYIQLFGYVLITFGILQHRGVPEFPCLEYNHDNKDDDEILSDEEEPNMQVKLQLVEEDAPPAESQPQQTEV